MTQLTEYFANGALHQGTCNGARSGMPADYYSQTGLFTRLLVPAQNDKEFTLPPRRKRAGELRLAA